MFNPKTIRSLSAAVLAATMLSICFNASPSTKNSSAQASAIPASTALATINMDENSAIGNNTITSPVSSDMDDNGNQVYVWAYTDSFSGAECNGVRYQRFQMSGLPLTDKTDVVFNCTRAGANNHQYLHPDVAMDRLGDFIVTWTDQQGSSDPNIEAQAISYNNQKVGGPAIVEDDASSLTTYTVAKVALNKNEANYAMHFGVNWVTCDTSSICGSGRNEDSAQIYTIDFTNLAGPEDVVPARVNPNNLVLNTAPYEVSSDDAPAISFSNNNFLAVWAGYNQTNDDGHWAIFGRTIGEDGSVSTDIFQLTNFISREGNPSLTGVLRPTPALNGSDVFYLSLSDSYQTDDNNDIYVQKIICAGTTLNCASTTRANGDPIFVRANTSTTGNENLSTIRAFTNDNPTDKTLGDENSSSDYFNVSWCSLDPDSNTAKVYTQNFKNDLARAGTEITVDTFPDGNCDSAPSVAMDPDANYSVSYLNAFSNEVFSKIYQSLYLRIGAESLVHAPDNNNFQGNPRTAINSNGNHLIAYESVNSDGWKDVIYALYDKNGNAIKNTSIVNPQNDGDNYQPEVAFFTDDSSSPDYGKFIISWHYDNDEASDGAYYQLFNADGSKIGGATLVASNIDFPKVAAGKFKQFIITYRQNPSIGGDPLTLQYLYQNDGNSITGTVTSAPFTEDIDNPLVTLSPDADGTTGIGGNSKFVIAWNNVGNHEFEEGYLASSSSVSLSSAQSGPGNFYDVSSAIVPALGNLTPPKNSFMYIFTGSNSDFRPELYAFTYGDGSLTGSAINLNSSISNPRIAIDKATGNFLVSWDDFNNFTNEINPKQILMFTKDSGTVLNQGDHISGDSSGQSADIAGGDFTNNYYYSLISATGPFSIGENIATSLDIPIAGTTPGVNIYFDHNVSHHFVVGSTVTGQSSGDSGVVEAVYSNFIFVDNLTAGNFQPGEQLDNDYQDTIVTTDDAYLLDVTPNFDLPFGVGDTIHDQTSSASGDVMDISTVMNNDTPTSIVNVANLTGPFNGNDFIRISNDIGTFTPDTIGVIKAQFYRLNLSQPSDSSTWVSEFGPEFSPNTHFNYGQYLNSSDIDFDSRSTDDDGKMAVFAYNISGDQTYLDENGVLQQTVEDPFSVGQKEDLSPITNQQINPGGKYIVVPQLIDFGNVARSATGTVNFSDLTMPDSSNGRLEITDLDGTDFDLTVSLSTLTNTTQPTATIPNTNFVIANNDGSNTGGANPGVSTSYSFSNVSDVTLDPSTNPDQNANLSTTQTLVRKNNNNTGVWDIYPQVKLTIPDDAANGVYSGTITFTLI